MPKLNAKREIVCCGFFFSSSFLERQSSLNVCIISYILIHALSAGQKNLIIFQKYIIFLQNAPWRSMVVALLHINAYKAFIKTDGEMGSLVRLPIFNYILDFSPVNLAAGRSREQLVRSSVKDRAGWKLCYIAPYIFAKLIKNLYLNLIKNG